MSNTPALIVAVLSPLIILLGLIYGALRKLHKTLHQWLAVWQLPAKVDALAGELHELNSIVRAHLDPSDPPRRARREEGRTWPASGR